MYHVLGATWRHPTPGRLLQGDGSTAEGKAPPRARRG